MEVASSRILVENDVQVSSSFAVGVQGNGKARREEVVALDATVRFFAHLIEIDPDDHLW